MKPFNAFALGFLSIAVASPVLGEERKDVTAEQCDQMISVAQSSLKEIRERNVRVESTSRWREISKNRVLAEYVRYAEKRLREGNTDEYILGLIGKRCIAASSG